jgi:hypothetical protein
MRVQDTFLKCAGLKKDILSFRLHFLGSKARLQQEKNFWLPRGNQSISQETIPQENPVFKPAHPQLCIFRVCGH